MFFRALALGACAALAAAQSKVLSFTHVPNPMTDGQAQAILYQTNDTDTKVSILLRQGNPGDLKTVMTLTSDAQDGQFVWFPPKSLPDGDNYALEIEQGEQVNYYGPFEIQGSNPAAVSSASASSSSSSSSSLAMSSASKTSASAGPTSSSSNSTTATATAPLSTGVSGNSTSISSNGTMRSMVSSSRMSTATMTTGGAGSTTSTASTKTAGAPSGSATASANGSAGVSNLYSSFALILAAVASFVFLQ